jgi:hypothetical protein
MIQTNANDEVLPMVVAGKSPKETRSRDERPTGSVHYGDLDFTADGEILDATWGEVAQNCCVHTPEEWGMAFVGFLLICFFLYFFLFGLELLGESAKVMVSDYMFLHDQTTYYFLGQSCSLIRMSCLTCSLIRMSYLACSLIHTSYLDRSLEWMQGRTALW